MMYKIVFLFSFLLAGCSNLNVSGTLSGDERGGNSQFMLKTAIFENISLKSKVSKPYNYTNPKLLSPSYTETGREILF